MLDNKNNFTTMIISYMARVTIERTYDKCDNRFKLVMLVAYRAHAIANGSQTAVNSDNKFAVIALREVEAGKIDIDELEKTVIEKYALENQVSVADNTFIIEDNSVKFDDATSTTEDDKNNTVGKNVTLNVDKDYFA